MADDNAAAHAPSAIVPRAIRFELEEGMPSHWCPSRPEFSHVASAFMAALPQLEPYFIHNIREAARHIEDPRLLSDIEGFVAQEARHAQQHRRFNDLLAKRYPQLAELERVIKQRLERSKREHSLAFRMAYTSGYEAITYQLVGFMMDQHQTWLSDADPHVLGLLCWHGAEEVEHKTVAFEAFEAVHGGYALRVRGLLSALVMTVKDIRMLAQSMLRSDGLWTDPASRRRLRAVRIAFARGLVPRFRHYVMPGYDPAAQPDPATSLAWLARYAAGEDLRAIAPEALDGLRR